MRRPQVAWPPAEKNGIIETTYIGRMMPILLINGETCEATLIRLLSPGETAEEESVVRASHYPPNWSA